MPSKMEFSNFYCPSSDETIRLNKHENSATHAAVATEEWKPGSLAASIPTGLSDCAKMNTNYANLLRDFGVDDMNKCQIMAELESVLGIKITGRTEEPAQWAPVQPDEESRQRVHSQLMLLRLYKRWAMSSIAAKLSMQVYEVRSFVKEYKRKLKAVIRSRADEARQKRSKTKTKQARGWSFANARVCSGPTERNKNHCEQAETRPDSKSPRAGRDFRLLSQRCAAEPLSM